MQCAYIAFVSHIIFSRKMSSFDQEQKKIPMDVDSGNEKTTASEPVGIMEMSASDDEQNK